MFGTVDMNSINNINEMPRNPEWDQEGTETDLAGAGGHSARLDPEDLVARAKASIMAASAGMEAGMSVGFSGSVAEPPGPAVDMRVGIEVEPEPSIPDHTLLRSVDMPATSSPLWTPVTQTQTSARSMGDECLDDLEAEAEIKVRVKTGDLLYTRADLMVRRDNHLSAVVDGVLLDLGMINTELMNAMALAHQVHVSAGHYLGGIIERRVPLVHQ